MSTTRDPATDQTLPTPTAERPVADIAIDLIRQQAAKGRAKYGTDLQASNGRDHLQDAREECVDRFLYDMAEYERRRTSGLTLDEYQRRTADTAIYPGQGEVLGALYAALGAVSEAGEILTKLYEYAVMSGAMRPTYNREDVLSVEQVGKAVNGCDAAGKLNKRIRDEGHRLGVREGAKLPSVTADMIATETGDLAWYVAQLASECGAPLSKIGMDNLAKLAGRKSRGTLGGSGDDR